jgi:hypoxanthine phosphoribosyltransferase
MQDLSFKEIRQRLNNFVLPDFDLIIAIANGGIVPASLVAYRTGIEMRTIRINYRDEKNNPLYETPQLITELNYEVKKLKLLIVDDVSVTGKTLEKASSILNGNEISTLVFKGKADFVLFPEIKTCVNWPWKVSDK